MSCWTGNQKSSIESSLSFFDGKSKKLNEDSIDIEEQKKMLRKPKLTIAANNKPAKENPSAASILPLSEEEMPNEKITGTDGF